MGVEPQRCLLRKVAVVVLALDRAQRLPPAVAEIGEPVEQLASSYSRAVASHSACVRPHPC
jgi:hypothetical protein